MLAISAVYSKCEPSSYLIVKFDIEMGRSYEWEKEMSCV